MLVGLIYFFALAYSVDSSCKGELNTNEILRDEPRFVNSVPNGKHYVVGDGYDKINIVHLYGNTPYEMGYAMGKLMSKDLNQLVTEYFAYLVNHAEKWVKALPPVKRKFSIKNFYFDENSLLLNGLLILVYLVLLI